MRKIKVEHPVRDARSVEDCQGRIMNTRPVRDARSVAKTSGINHSSVPYGTEEGLHIGVFTDLLCLTAQLDGSQESFYNRQIIKYLKHILISNF
jgi:hypothetical protein